MYTLSKIVISVALSALINVAAYAESPNVDNKKNIRKLHTSKAAIAKANEYIGFDSVSEFYSVGAPTAELVKIKKDNTPFTARMITSRPTWQITYPDVKIDLWGAVDKRDFHVVLDPETGYILSVYSVSDNAGSSDTLPEPSAEAAEKYLGNLVFNGIPKEPPQISFAEALKNCPANPATVKSIRAMYISYTVRKHDYDAVWLIIMRGIKNPIPVSSRGGTKLPERLYNTLMITIDAKTGVCISAETAPYDRKQIREYNKKHR